MYIHGAAFEHSWCLPCQQYVQLWSDPHSGQQDEEESKLRQTWEREREKINKQMCGCRKGAVSIIFLNTMEY